MQEPDKEVRNIRAVEELQDRYKKIDEVLYYQRLLFVPEIIQTKIISRYHNNSLTGHFGVDNKRKLIGQKYY